MITPKVDLPTWTRSQHLRSRRSLTVSPDLEAIAPDPGIIPAPAQRMASAAQGQDLEALDTTGIVVPMSWEYVHRRFYRSMMRLQRGKARTSSPAADTIYKMRNMGVEWARSCGARHLLFLDADMVFPEHTLVRLLSHRQPIVGGLCRQRREPFAACMWEERENKLYRVPPEGEGLRSVAFTGGACLLIDMAVFGALDRAFPGEPYFMNRECYAEKVLDGDYMGEDAWFCLRARQAGYEVLVDQSLKVGHVTTAIIYDDDEHRPTALLEKGMD